MRRPPLVVAFALAIAFLVLSLLAGLRLGAVDLSFGQLFEVITAGPNGDALPWQRTIVWQVRMPRVAAGAFVGAALAVSGAALQGLFRNPLADPGVIGVSAGASFGAVAAMYLGLAARTAWAIPALAVAGAAATAFAVYAMASRRGRTPVATLLLAGIAVGSLASAMTSFVLSLSLDEYEQGRQMFRWLMGGLEARTWAEVGLVAPPTLLGSAVIVALSRELDALLLGEVQAAAVGVDVPRVRKVLIFATALVTGSAVAVSGIIGFVGLVIPHVLRLLVGPMHGALLPMSWLAGAAFLVATDSLARTLLAPEEIRLGVMTATLGAPFFLFLLMRRKRKVAME